jgi:hypothetical protein
MQVEETTTERSDVSVSSGLSHRAAIAKMKEESERQFFTDDVPQLDDRARKCLLQKAVAQLPRWITPNDPLPEIPDWLKPNK